MTTTAPAAHSSARVLEADVDALAERARALISDGRRHILGVTGTPGAGKSTVAAAVAERLGSQAVLVGMDAFHLSDAQLDRLGRLDRKGAPDTFDVAGYRSLLSRIAAGDETVYSPVFDRSIEASIAAATVVLPEVPLVITEGNYLLMNEHGWSSIRPLLDAVWFIDVAPDERVRRLEARRRAHGHAADAATAWVRNVDERNATLVDSTRDRADLIVHPTQSAAWFSATSNTNGAPA